ncbi:transglycosylase domain-containing protein [Dermacoccaceae bacterium W4C1]
MRLATRVTNVLTLLGAFVATAMVMGLLGAGLVLPAVGAAGQATKGGVRTFNGLPSEFAINPLNEQSRILAKDGTVIATPYDESRIVVPLSKIAPIMRKAQVAIEDKRFYQHGGIDAQGLARAVASNFVSGSTQGASTLTQQYVKVVQQDQLLKKGDEEGAAAAISQTGMQGYLRKMQQIKISVNLEGKMSKDEILEGYLNTVYMGDQQYGVEAAARHYFGVSAANLNLPQAATLAGVVQRPGATDPVHNPSAAKNRRNTVLNRMLEQKMITPQQHADAVASPLKLNITDFDQSCASSKYAYYCYYVQDWLSKQPSLGKTPKERLARLRAGGLTIQTALDPKRMSIIDKQIQERVPTGDPSDVGAASVMIEPGTGVVSAMGQNTTYSNTAGSGKSALNYAAPTGGSSLGFPIGSSAKIFAIITAIKQGRGVDSTVDVPRTTQIDDGVPRAVLTREDFGGACGLTGKNTFTVGNSHVVRPGPMSLTDITKESVNTAFAKLVGELGACNVRDTFNQFEMGKTTPLPAAITLGTDSHSPLTLANAYATIAAGGKYCTPRPVTEITQADGKKLSLSIPACKQLIPQDQAEGVAQIFHGPFESGGGTASNSRLADGRDAMGKTGTTNNAEATWFVGSTPSLTTATFVGRTDSNAALRNITIGGKHYSGFVYADDIAAPLWKGIMDEALKGTTKETFTKPPESILRGKEGSPGQSSSTSSASPTDGAAATSTSSDSSSDSESNGD